MSVWHEYIYIRIYIWFCIFIKNTLFYTFDKLIIDFKKNPLLAE